MESNIINTKRNVYTLKFINSPELYFFQSDEQLNEILKMENIKHGIEKIQMLNYKGSFKRVSKKDFAQYFSYNTEAIEIMKSINFLK